jgi:hypothetical protein
MFETECPEIQSGILSSYNLTTVYIFKKKKGTSDTAHKKMSQDIKTGDMTKAITRLDLDMLEPTE